MLTQSLTLSVVEAGLNYKESLGSPGWKFHFMDKKDTSKWGDDLCGRDMCRIWTLWHQLCWRQEQSGGQQKQCQTFHMREKQGFLFIHCLYLRRRWAGISRPHHLAGWLPTSWEGSAHLLLISVFQFLWQYSCSVASFLIAPTGRYHLDILSMAFWLLP